MLCLIIFTLVLAILVYKVLKFHDHWKERDVPFEKTWPFLGELATFLFKTETFPENVARIYKQIGSKRYSGIYQFLTPILFIKDPDLIKDLAIKNFDSFVDHREFISAEVDKLLGRTLLTLKGKEWHKIRTSLSPAFTGSKMKFMFGFITECVDQFLEYLMDTNTDINSLEVKDAFSRYTNDVIANAAFGVQCNSFKEQNNEFYKRVCESSQISGLRALKLFVSSASPILAKILKPKVFPEKTEQFFKNIVYEAIKFREENNIVRPDMIHLMIEAKNGKLKHDDEESNLESNENKKFEFTDDDIVAQCLVFVLAGFDTSSTMLSYACYELAVNRDIQERLQEEIDQILVKFNGKLQYEALFEMKFLDMVLSETLRKYPSIPVTDRVCVKDRYIIEAEQPGEKSLTLVKGDIVLFPTYALQMDPKYFPEPQKFDPERFSPENKRNIRQGSYLPFGIGPRNCIGSRFAMMESKAVLFCLLSKFDIVTTEKTQIPVKLAKANLNMGSEKGIWLGFKKRLTT